MPATQIGYGNGLYYIFTTSTLRIEKITTMKGLILDKVPIKHVLMKQTTLILIVHNIYQNTEVRP